MFRRSVPACLIITFFVSGADAAEVGCPARASDPLLSVELFDGPIADNAALAPDRTTGSASKGRSTWAVRSVYEQGRTLFLTCRYKSSPKPVVLEIPNKVATCNQIIDAKTGGSFTCK